ncbi:hypothetical protein OnM2_056025b [Erysiphe neolycopersici]|uniref:Uncharacterized protein n=1 Tax=Erysiphe neolycopersici TaxID=212602 RepID=A0A420HR04_9PEZI|nr:hypothetical protein OnM2_056025b [Erysiphe neolycopersici]
MTTKEAAKNLQHKSSSPELVDVSKSRSNIGSKGKQKGRTNESEMMYPPESSPYYRLTEKVHKSSQSNEYVRDQDEFRIEKYRPHGYSK